MKKYYLYMLAILVMASCSNKQRSHNEDDEDEDDEELVEKADSELKTKTYKFEQTKGMTTVTLTADFPVNGNEALKNSISEFISESIGGSYDGSLTDAQGMIDYYGENLMKSYGEIASEYTDDDYVHEIYYHETLTKSYETDGFVTYTDETQDYTGGVHGMYYIGGMTFRKSDGRRFDIDMMRHVEGYDFKQLLKEGLKKFFCEGDDQESISDDDLKEYLINLDGDIDDIPLPSCPPYLTDKGIHFIYQPYEISFYAAGTPEVIIPFEDAKPFLTNAAIEMIEK